ncbi:MAG: helix-turn-helix domain-containing protein [Methylocella sp.]|nr:MAG: hypothetical protein DLM68_14505 [Hyphomicrobiales bacterium]
MRRTEAFQGVRIIKFLRILSRYEASEFPQLEAAELLGVGERTFRRWRRRFEDEGEAGLASPAAGQGFGQAGSGRLTGFSPSAAWALASCGLCSVGSAQQWFARSGARRLRCRARSGQFDSHEKS